MGCALLASWVPALVTLPAHCRRASPTTWGTTERLGGISWRVTEASRPVIGTPPDPSESVPRTVDGAGGR